MKKIYFLLIGLSVLVSCSSNEEEPATVCKVTEVNIFDEANTRFVFTDDGADGYHVANIIEYENTDSSFTYTYAYDGVTMQSITIDEGGSSLVYNATYDNNKLSKLITNGSSTDLASELVLVYSGDNVLSLETWVKAIDNNLYQVGHFAYTYNGSSDMITSEFNLDFVALLTIAFGGVPDVAYAPASFGSTTYEYGQDSAPNALNGVYYMENPDIGFMKNMPISVVHQDRSGNITGSDAFALTFNEFGYPIKATSGNSFIDVTYDCN